MSKPNTYAEWTSLAERAKAGDREAAEVLGEKLGLLACKVFRCGGLSAEDAEDLSQECVWHIFNRLDCFHGKKFSGWVNAILRNTLRDHFRKLRRRLVTVPILDNDQNLLEENLSANGTLDEAGHAAIEEALQQLDAFDRTLIESQTGFQKLPFREIAGELDISETAARVRHHRAQRKLRLLLENDRRMKRWIMLHS